MLTIARVDLGMTEEQFLACSPREFDAFCNRLHTIDRKQQLNAALICSVIANVNRDPKFRPKAFTPEDFMPQAEQVQTDAQQVKMLSIIFGCGPGMKGKPESSRKAEMRPKVKHG